MHFNRSKYKVNEVDTCLHCANVGHFNSLSDLEIQAKLKRNLYLGTYSVQIIAVIVQRRL